MSKHRSGSRYDRDDRTRKDRDSSDTYYRRSRRSSQRSSSKHRRSHSASSTERDKYRRPYSSSSSRPHERDHRSRRSRHREDASREKGRRSHDHERKRRKRSRERKPKKSSSHRSKKKKRRRSQSESRSPSVEKDAFPLEEKEDTVAVVVKDTTRDTTPSSPIISVQEDKSVRIETTPMETQTQLEHIQSVPTTTAIDAVTIEPDARDKQASPKVKQEEEAKTTMTKSQKLLSTLDVNAIQARVAKALELAKKSKASSRETSAIPSEDSTTIEIRERPDDSGPAPVVMESAESPQKEIPVPVTQAAEIIQPKEVPLELGLGEPFDMFAENVSGQVGQEIKQSMAHSSTAVAVLEDIHQSNWDDAEGYYQCTVGEIIHQQYQVLGQVGRGVFSTVLQCKQLHTKSRPEEEEAQEVNVAIKLVRNNDTMKKAAINEYKILRQLHRPGTGRKRNKYVIECLDAFEYRNHNALVFEVMSMNLREAMKKFGGKSGISLQAVQMFSKQLFSALRHLQQHEIVHADIKPDNILLNETQNIVKLCDLGSAFSLANTTSDQEPTPYLVSRFYRAPEIILGLSYDYGVDMWAIGSCIYEMYTGKIAFPGRSNNEMLKCFMEYFGRIPNKLLKKHKIVYVEHFQLEPHFSDENQFISLETDRISGQPVKKSLDFHKPTKCLGENLKAAKTASDDSRVVQELKNLLERIFVFDPSKRISVTEALAHPFLKI